MRNKRALIKVSIFVALLVFGFVGVMAIVFNAGLDAQAYVEQNDYSLPYSEEVVVEQLSSSLFRTIGDEGLTADDIRSILNSGGQIYQNIREHSDRGTRTYRVPIPAWELEYLLNPHSRILSTNESTFSYTRIRYSGRSHEDSIVIVLMGDGFTAAQYAPMTTPGRVLWHADRAIDALMVTPPFDLFACLFTVYVVHVHTPPDQAGFLGTVTADRFYNYERLDVHQFSRIREHATAPTGLVAENITMIQILVNARDGVGHAQDDWSYGLRTPINVARTSLRADTRGGVNVVWPRDTSVPVAYNGTGWHGTFVHEFGHSFGKLVDERPDATSWHREWRANATRAVDAEVKWRHWGGHRNVLEVPTRFPDGWTAPGVVSDIPGQSSCIMHASDGNRNFCGVCTAELVRRLALVSGETFHGRSPASELSLWDPEISYPWINTPVIPIPQGATRILDSAFHGNRSIETVHIPASVETIGDFAFIGTTNLRTIYNNRTVPQQINSTTFADVERELVTVMIPFGTTQAYLAAGWSGFSLVETAAPDLSITLHFYGRPDAPVVLPVTLGQPLCPITVANITRQVYGEGPYDNNGGWAFWGWFTDAQLDSSERVRDGHRRPTVGTMGFDIGAVMTAELIGSLAVNGNVNLYAVWALWGDLNDDGRIDHDDLDSLTRFVSRLVPRPVINLPPADVNRDDLIDVNDVDMLHRHVSRLTPRFVLGQRPVAPAFVPFSVGDLAFGVSQERGAPGDYVLMRVSVAENTALGFNVALLDVGFDSDVLEFVGYIGGNYNAKGMRLLTTVHTSAYPQEDDAVRIVWIRCIYETTSYTYTGLYLELEFRIRDNAQSGTSEINLTAPYFGGAVGIGGNIPLTLMPGSVTVNN